MTALQEYDRLESGGLWRENAQAQRREVVVSFGHATLVISDSTDRPLAHWSLPAVRRENQGQRPAIYAPDEDADETLEIADEAMIEAIERVRAALAKAQPKPGRLRGFATLGLITATLALAVIWLPGALQRQTLSVVPQVKRAEIGANVLGHLQRLNGARCSNQQGQTALQRLHRRVLGPQAAGQIIVLPKLDQLVAALPGGLIVLDRSVIENASEPAVTAGFIAAAQVARSGRDPLADVLETIGLKQTMTLLTTGDIPLQSLASTARAVADAKRKLPDTDALIAGLATARLPTAPFAQFAYPMTDDQQKLIDGDQYAERDEPDILSDGNWIRLQGICSL